MRRVRVGQHDVGVSEVLSSYWHFAAERQHVYHARLRGEPGPWTDDVVLSRYRFTNAYRAADRVSQDLIRIAYEGPQDPEKPRLTRSTVSVLQQTIDMGSVGIKIRSDHNIHIRCRCLQQGSRRKNC